MKALQFDRTGDLAALELVDMPDPLPAADEVRVEIRAAGLNPSDVKNVLGRFPYTTLPRVPGRDFAGVVVEGPKALLGQAVWGTGREPGFFRDGSHAQFLTLPAAGVALKPESLSFAQAASCGVPYSTAWDALQRSQVKAGTPPPRRGPAPAPGWRAPVAHGWPGGKRARPRAAARQARQGRPG